jgi:hypothetical protein
MYTRRERFLSFTNGDMLLILPIIGYCMYLACTLPLSYDESFTLKYFTNRGFFHSLVNYPVTNNHVLHTLLTNIIYPLVPLSNSISLRLPAIIFAVFTLILAKNELQDHPRSFFLFVLVLVFSFGFIEFNFQARSYSMQTFFALFSYILYTRSTYFIERWYLFILISVLGLYASPAYLYSAIPIGIMFVVKNREIIKGSLKECSIPLAYGMFAIVTLYAPIILKSGSGVLLSNPTVRPLEHVSIIEVIKHLIVSFNWFVFGNWGIFVLIIFSLLVVFKKNFILLLLIICPVVMMICLKQLPFPRIFLPVYIICVLYIVQNMPAVALQKIIPANTYLMFLLLTIASFISLKIYRQSEQRGDIRTAFEMQRIAKTCDITELRVDTNVSWYFKTTYEGYCIIHKSQLHYTEDSAITNTIHPVSFITTDSSYRNNQDSFVFIVPHYLVTD